MGFWILYLAVKRWKTGRLTVSPILGGGRGSAELAKTAGSVYGGCLGLSGSVGRGLIRSREEGVKGEEMKNLAWLAAVAVILALGMIGSAALLSKLFVNIKHEKEISVKGYAERDVVSDVQGTPDPEAGGGEVSQGQGHQG